MVTGVSHRSFLVHPQLKVTMGQTPCRERSLYIVGGVGTSDRTLKINNPDIRTLECALLERMYYCDVGGVFVSPPCPNGDTIKSRLQVFRNRLLRKVGRPSKISPEQFAQMYRGRKRTIYEQAIAEYSDYGVLRKHSVSAAFVKCEKVPVGKAPRCIQPRHPVYNVGLGCYIKHIEHRMYAAIGKVFDDKVTVVKGFNVRQVANILVAKWDSFSDCVAVGLDATKFDMHVSDSMLLWEHSIYKTIYAYDPELVRLLGWQVNNKGVGRCEDGKLKYSVRGRRFSGDMNTALGNCLLMCAMVWSYASERGVRVKLMNNGDDCQVFMERCDLDRFMVGLNDWFMEMGFRMTVEEPVHEVQQVEFCQMKPVETVNGWVMVRNIDKAREKDSMSIIPLATPNVLRKWLYAVGECGLALCGGVPIMQAMYKAYIRQGFKSRMGDSVAMQSGARLLAMGIESKEAVITAKARLDVFTAWGYTPDEQTALEAWYDALVFESIPRLVDTLEEIDHSPL